MRRTLAALALTLALPGPALLAPPARAQAVVVVREGDTLSDIAERHGVGLTRLMQANGISDPDLVVVGQRLTIPGGGGRSGGGTTSGGGGSVTVQAGDTLSDIAARHGISVSRLMQANGISDPDLVVTGQRLTIPGSGRGSSSPPTRSPQPTAPYTVKSGETLSDIATRFNTSTERLIQLNGLRNPDLVMSGTRLQVPVAPKRQTAKPASAPTRPAAPDRNARQHVVESGESLSVIAGRYGTTVEQLVALNRIEDPDRLLAGTRLQLRSAPPAPAARPAASPQQAVQPAPRPAPQPTPQAQAQPRPQPQTQSQPQPQAQAQPRPQPQASTEPAAAARSHPAAVMPTRESTPTPSRTEAAPTSTTKTSPAKAAATVATAGTAATTAPAASTASAATAARATVAASAASARSTANAPTAAAATATPQPRPQPPVQTRPVQPASVRTTAPSTSRIAASTQGVAPTQAGTAPTARSTTGTASTPATTTATSTAKRTPSAAAVTTGPAAAAKGAATGSSTVAARSTSRTSASSGDWRSYGPLQIDWANWQSMGGSYVAPSLNSDGKARYLAVNCTARKLNTTTPAGQWNSWESPAQDFEKKLVQDICKEKGG
ncbi:MAG: LysM peptidoglycan-binding domain-containing protein [Cyanobium sp. Prado107]|jgi:LysM repeat protein|nr:LysM peptidoglycan-binding domain-containing protein [Cyanobium sp. Prado107]